MERVRGKGLVTVLLSVLFIILFFGVVPFIVSCGDDDDDNNDDNGTQTPVATQLTDDDSVENGNRIWPGGERILFDQDEGNSHCGLYTVPLDGSKTKTCISPGSGTYHYPDVNPAGTHICYSTGADDTEIWEIGLYEMGNAEAILTNNAVLDGRDSHFPVFNGDGSRIAYVKRDWGMRIDTLVHMDIEGNDEVTVCTLAAGAMTSIECLDWLGQTDYLIYTTRNGNLYRISTAGDSTPTELAPGSDYHTCSSSSDGSMILCAQSAGTGQEYIEMNADGTNKRVIVTESEYPNLGGLFCQVCWLPDRQGIISMATDSTGTIFDFYLLEHWDDN